MSNPAIVLMTDPSRCDLGDVHYLVQALLEVQQMGEHAIPQALCDHPDSAREFIDAYAHAYPQLVLEDREIPTPDHLESLLSAGQIGALGQPAALAPPDGARSPAEPSEANGVPIVVLTLGSSQALFDALQQTPAMRESIRLIDVAPERTDVLSVADAIAIRGLDGETWQRRSGTELDDVPGVAKAGLTSLALHDDHLSLDVVETVEAPSKPLSAYRQGPEHQPAWVEPPAAAANAAPAAADEPARPSTAVDVSPVGTAATEPAGEPQSQPTSQPASPALVLRSSDADLVASEPVGAAQSLEPEAPAPADAAEKGGQVGEPSTGAAGESKGAAKNAPDGIEKEGDAEGDAAGKADKGAAGKDSEQDDVVYPPVGSLVAGADVVYPALDRSEPYGVLRELASVLQDDGILDSELPADLVQALRGESSPAPGRQEAVVAFPQSDKPAAPADVYDAGAQDDQLADALARPLHDSDL
jgi:hypothetical protein